jgi:hypothetical protein
LKIFTDGGLPVRHTNDVVVPLCRRILEEHRRACEATGKYVEAEVAKKRIIELRAE